MIRTPSPMWSAALTSSARRSSAALGRRKLARAFGLGAGGAILSPMLEGLVAEAQGRPAAKRVVFVLSGNGFLCGRTPPDLLVMQGDRKQPPGGASNKTVQSLPFQTMPGMMAGLERHRGQLLLLDDLTNGAGQGHWQSYAAMTCVPNNHEEPGAASIDHFLSTTLGADAPIGLLPLAVVKRDGQATTKAVSAVGARQPIVSRCDPRDVHALLFPVGGNNAPIVERERRLLDLLKGDIKRASGKLAGGERAKLDEYISVIEAVEARQRSLVQVRGDTSNAACKPVETPTVLSVMEERTRAMFDLATAALICRFTKVVTLACNTHQDFDATYRGLGYTMDLHSIGHGGRDSKMGDDTAIHNFHAGLMAKMVDTLKAVPEGNGSMFDNTVIVWLNDNGTSHHSRPADSWLVTLIGNAGGTLKSDGRYLRFPKSGAGFRKVNDVFTTVANALGVKVEHFQPTSPIERTGSISEIRV